jgi:penicillin G amidase
MALDLTGNYRSELLRAGLARTLSAEQLAFLYPEYPRTAPTTLAELAALYHQLPLDALYAALPPADHPVYASNNWVVDGARSASGKPLLANDPHLSFGAPGIWYLARLKTPEREIAGGTAAGGPLVVIGHNHRIAWGFTTTVSDVSDLFIEKIDPADPERYLTPHGSAPFEKRQETIEVRGAASIPLTIRTTRHGPVLSDILPAGYVEPGYVLALAASFLIDDDRSAEALWHVNRAADWESFRTALSSFVVPQQNMVFGDADGTIGFIAPALIPIRKNGNGWLPVPGWTGEYDWTGFVPFDELPQASNPDRGHFVSANNKIVPDSYPHFLSRDWDLPYRAERIEELLAAEPRQSPAASAAIQADTLSLAAQRLVPLMTRIVPDGDMPREAIQRLQAWDFRMDAAAVEPLLFTAWLRSFARQLFFGNLGEAAAGYWGLNPPVVKAVLTGRSEWCTNAMSPVAGGAPGRAPAGEGCGALLAASLDAALAELSREFGPDMAQWQWGRAHIARFPNTVLGRIPGLRYWFDVGIATDGAFDTVNRGATTIRDDARPYEHRHGAGFRIITDLAAPGDSRMIVAPGQSGNPLSPHFSDLLQRWRDFEYLVPGRAAPVATLTLAPR